MRSSNFVAENNESAFVFINTSIALSISLCSLKGEVACKNTIISGEILWLDCINSIAWDNADSDVALSVHKCLGLGIVSTSYVSANFVIFLSSVDTNV